MQKHVTHAMSIMTKKGKHFEHLQSADFVVMSLMCNNITVIRATGKKWIADMRMSQRVKLQ